MRYYTYAHLNPATLQPFYVGKGCLDRHKQTSSRNPYWWNYTDKYGWISAIVRRFETEEEALAEEVRLISYLKSNGVELVNLTEGGDRGAAIGNKYNLGKKLSESAKEKISKSSKGRLLRYWFVGTHTETGEVIRFLGRYELGKNFNHGNVYRAMKANRPYQDYLWTKEKYAQAHAFVQGQP